MVAGPTESDSVATLFVEPAVPTKVMVTPFSEVFGGAAMEICWEVFAVSEIALGETVTPEGRPVTATEIVELKPPVAVSEIVTALDSPAGTVTLAGLTARV